MAGKAGKNISSLLIPFPVFRLTETIYGFSFEIYDIFLLKKEKNTVQYLFQKRILFLSDFPCPVKGRESVNDSTVSFFTLSS